MTSSIQGTSAEVATYAAKILRSDEYPKIIKSVAAAALAQRRKPKKK
ncbi:MAG TPA: hypothetical protein VGH33_07115 [Isosphaeraceae bacterium]|jgi:hypothetical protein